MKYKVTKGLISKTIECDSLVHNEKTGSTLLIKYAEDKNNVIAVIPAEYLITKI